MKKHCDWCSSIVEVDSHMKWMNHRRNCKSNPKREQICKKISNTSKKERKEFTFKCKKCKESFKLVLIVDHFKKGKHKKYCSRQCANSRNWTKKDKQKKKKAAKSFHKNNPQAGKKIGKKNKKVHETRTCLNENCSNTFETTARRNKIYCSHTCTMTSSTYNATKSKILKKEYRKGRKTYGGNTKWYTVNTKVNGKIKVQGSYEKRVCRILDKWYQQGKITDWKYTKDRFPYVGLDNKEHTYLVDFKVFEKPDKFYYIESKGFERPNDKLKWKAVRDKGYRLDVWFDKEITQMEFVV